MAGLTVAAILNGLASGGVKLQDWEGDHLNSTNFTDLKATISGVKPVNLKFEFKEGGTAKKVEGQRPLLGGDPQVVKIDGVPVPGARITFRPTTQGAKGRLIVKCIVKDSPEERYRFDATVKGLGI